MKLRASLLKEKAKLETRLGELDNALADGEMTAMPARRGRPAGVSSAKNGGRRPKNVLSLREAVGKVTGSRAMTKKEIFDAVQKIGYKFGGKDPMNSLNVVLYSKKQFKNDGGKFSPA
ncbi:MAG TPA: hypothetical protein VHH73_19810 [Verrucomicrobiae bacterium]|nr:hypothetical protein [Verrucomicrobiae bacterium]